MTPSKMVSTSALLFLVLISIVDEGESSLLNGPGKSTIMASKNEGNAATNGTKSKSRGRQRDNLDIVLQVTKMIEKALGSPVPISSIAEVIKKIIGESIWDQVQNKIDQTFANGLTEFNQINIKEKLDYYKHELEELSQQADEENDWSEADRKHFIENIEDLFDGMKLSEHKFNPANYLKWMRYDPGFYQAYIAEISLKYLVMNLAMEQCKLLPSGQVVSTFQWRAWQDKIEKYKKEWAAFAKNWGPYEYLIWSPKSLSCSRVKNFWSSTIALKCHHNGLPRKHFSIEFKASSSGGTISAKFRGSWYREDYKDETSIEPIHKGWVFLYWYEVRKPILRLIKDPKAEEDFFDFLNPPLIKVPYCIFPRPCVSPCRKFGYSKNWCFSGWKQPQFIVPHAFESNWSVCHPDIYADYCPAINKNQ